MGGLPLWERRTGRNPGTQINTYSGRHTQFIGHAALNEDGGGVTASPPAPSSCQRCSFCPPRICGPTRPVRLTDGLLTAATPRLPRTPRHPHPRSFPSRSRWQTPTDSSLFISICRRREMWKKLHFSAKTPSAPRPVMGEIKRGSLF